MSAGGFEVGQRCNACGFEHTVTAADAPGNCPECGGFLQLVGNAHREG